MALTFPAVAKGDQDLSGFAYSSPSVTFGATAPTLTAPTVLESAALSYTSTAAVCTVDASSGALALVAAGACTVTVSAAATTNYNADTATFEITVNPAGALTLRVDAVAGDDTVNIAEKAAGFSIGGTTGAAAGVAVTVVLGTQTFTAVTSAALTDHDDDTGTPEQAAWSVDVAADAAYITGASVALSVAAAKTGFTAPGQCHPHPDGGPERPHRAELQRARLTQGGRGHHRRDPGGRRRHQPLHGRRPAAGAGH